MVMVMTIFTPCQLMYGDDDGDGDNDGDGDDDGNGDEKNTLPPHSEYQPPLALLGSTPTYTLPAQKVIKRGKKSS